MPFDETAAAWERVEKAISEAGTDGNFRPAVVASLLAKGWTVEKGFEIARDQKLGCGLADLNLMLAMHYGLRVRDLELVNVEPRVEAVMESLEEDIPRTLLDEAVRSVLLEAEKTVRAVSKALTPRRVPLPGLSIGVLFGGKTWQKAEELFERSSRCFAFPCGVRLEFACRDGRTIPFTAELAASEKEQDTGFAGRPYLPDDAGMWYDLGRETITAFVTEGAVRPLSVAYVASSGRIAEIAERKARDRETYVNRFPARHVLEVPSPWFKANGIGEGDTVRPVTVLAWS